MKKKKNECQKEILLGDIDCRIIYCNYIPLKMYNIEV